MKITDPPLSSADEATPAYATASGSDGHVLATHCPACGYNNFPPSRVCAGCMSLDVEPLRLSRQGTLYSYTTLRAGDQSVYVGYVDLPEKIRLFAELEGYADGPPAMGSQLELACVRHAPGQARKREPVFVFRHLPGQPHGQ